MEQSIEIVSQLPDGSEALAGVFAARDYHRGQWSQLYRLSSSGKVTSLDGLAMELAEAIEIAENQSEMEDHSDLSALLLWVEAQS